MSIQHELRRVVESRESLTQEEAAALMRRILSGDASEVELASLLGGMAGRGETAAEVAGFAETLRAVATTLPLTEAEREALVDTCGTGGDGSGTFNISTAAALVAAAAGARVAKHGNRAITSRCGSADVLEALGVPTELGPEAAADALREHGFAFLLAPAHHPALRAVMPVRRAIGVRTVLHVLGPLLNPAGARRQVMGVYARRLVPLVAEAMTRLGTTHAMVVHGHGGLDELALSGPSYVGEVHRSAVAEVPSATFAERVVAPEELGFGLAGLEVLAGGDAATNAAILRKIFAGERGPRREIVVLNAAAVLVVAGVAEKMPQATRIAAEAIDSGAVVRLVERLRGR